MFEKGAVPISVREDNRRSGAAEITVARRPGGALAGSRHRPDEVDHASRRFPSRRVPRHRDPPALGGGQARR
jgi:hypothetical protein